MLGIAKDFGVFTTVPAVPAPYVALFENRDVLDLRYAAQGQDQKSEKGVRKYIF